MQTTDNIREVQRHAHDKDSADAMMSVRYTPDGKYVFGASSSGDVTVAKDGEKAMQFVRPAGDASDACTCVRVADVPPSAETGAYTCAATTSEGHVSLWSVVPGKVSKLLCFAIEEGNETMTCAMPPGTTDTVLTGGSDGTLRLYRMGAEDRLEIVQTVTQGIDRHGQPTLGPPAKTMAACFVDRNSVLVGGWESSVLLYDLRAKAVVRTFDGPRLSGDALDYRDGCVLTASHRPREQLQVFDFASGKQLTPSITVDTLPFACRLFGRASKLGAWVAGTSANGAYAVNLLTGQPMASVVDIPEAVYSIDVCPIDPRKATIGCAKGATYRVTAEL
jgi:hypothetical protein